MDPVLLTHGITDALFDIGPGFTPPSLRDQTIRAWLLTNKAAKNGVIGPSKPLLVVGAGLAGAVTALTAASLGVPTKIIDKSEKPLNVQLNCYSRVICPALYDWPASHWADGALPWSEGIPLLWREDAAGYVATALGEDFLAAVVGSPLLEFFPYTEVPKYEREALKDYYPQGDFAINFWNLHNDTLDPNGPYRFAAVISCLGPGVERSSLGTFTGFPFWWMDPFSYPDLNIPVTPRVYISGGGDGALQDFLRIATRLQTAKQVFLSLPEGVRTFIERAMLTKEDNFKRGHSWFAANDHDMYQHIQDYCADVIDQVLAAYWKELNKALEPMLAHLNEWTLRLAYRCKHFTNYYCLNRVLTLLVAHYWKRKTGKNLLMPEFETTVVEGAFPHKCKHKPWDCHGEDHTVVSHTSLCNHSFNVKHEEGSYNVVILRHGPEPPEKSFYGLPVHPRRQLLPYYL